MGRELALRLSGLPAGHPLRAVLADAAPGVVAVTVPLDYAGVPALIPLSIGFWTLALRPLSLQLLGDAGWLVYLVALPALFLLHHRAGARFEQRLGLRIRRWLGPFDLVWGLLHAWWAVVVAIMARTTSFDPPLQGDTARSLGALLAVTVTSLVLARLRRTLRRGPGWRALLPPWEDFASRVRTALHQQRAFDRAPFVAGALVPLLPLVGVALAVERTTGTDAMYALLAFAPLLLAALYSWLRHWWLERPLRRGAFAWWATAWTILAPVLMALPANVLADRPIAAALLALLLPAAGLVAAALAWRRAAGR